ncbi:hypothetical protein SCG7109_BK_00070, partial [Chlamydiales bacterium SCGC AG-110-M15]
MSDINSVDDNNLKRLSNILKKKGAISPKKSGDSVEGKPAADVADLSPQSSNKKIPMNDFQKISKWTQDLKEMKPDDARLDRIKERLESGFYSSPDVMNKLLD